MSCTYGGVCAPLACALVQEPLGSAQLSLGLKEATSHGLLHSYPVLHEKNGARNACHATALACLLGRRDGCRSSWGIKADVLCLAATHSHVDTSSHHIGLSFLVIDRSCTTAGIHAPY